MNIIEDYANRRVYLKIEAITHNIRRGIRQAYFRLGKQLKTYTSAKMLEKPKGGRTYYIRTRSGRLRKHKASAPLVEYAANMSGKTRRSLDFKVHGHEQLEFGANTPWAKWLELGTSKMQKRKLLADSIKDNVGNAVVYFDEEIKKYLSK